MTKHPLSEGDDDGDGGDGDGRISWPPPAPFPITPRDPISRSGIPLTPMFNITFGKIPVQFSISQYVLIIHPAI